MSPLLVEGAGEVEPPAEVGSMVALEDAGAVALEDVVEALVVATSTEEPDVMVATEKCCMQGRNEGPNDLSGSCTLV